MSVDRIDVVAARQHGVVTWKQLLACLPRTTIESWVAVGHIHRVAPEVYRFTGAPETWRQRVMIAVLDSGGIASHRTAAALHGVDGHPGRVIEVTVERWQRSSRRSFYKVHESKDLRGPDFDTRDGIPCTSLIRTLIDLPAVEHVYRAEQALDDACRLDRGTLLLTKARFQEVARRGRNGTTAMRSMIEERIGESMPAGSTFESKAVRLIKAAGIAKPVKQHMVEDGDFVAFIDLAWPIVMFGAECDSLKHHFGKRAHRHDRVRRRRLKRLGWEIAEYTYEEVNEEPDKVGAELWDLLLLAAKRSGVSEADIRA
jgi:hypothetical protein